MSVAYFFYVDVIIFSSVFNGCCCFFNIDLYHFIPIVMLCCFAPIDFKTSIFFTIITLVYVNVSKITKFISLERDSDHKRKIGNS